MESVAAPADSSSWPFILAIVVNSWGKWGVIFVVGLQMEDTFLKMGFPITSPWHWKGTSQRTLAPSVVTGLISGTSTVFSSSERWMSHRRGFSSFAVHVWAAGGVGLLFCLLPLSPLQSFPCKPSKAIRIMFCARTNCSIAGSLPRGNFHSSLSLSSIKHSRKMQSQAPCQC